jgi:hypothetical protein
MSRHHPPARLPASPPESSTIYKLHVPFGFVPLNALNADPPDGTGAGEGKVSTPGPFVGLNVPDTSGPASGRLVAAASSSVNVTLTASGLPPTSDIIIAFCPPGATSNMSTSSGNMWLKLFNLTVTLLTTPVNPEIASVDGYGLAAPTGLIVIAVGLHPPGHVPVTVTEKLQLCPAVAVQVTVVVPIGKNVPDAGKQLTAPHVPLVVGAA